MVLLVALLRIDDGAISIDKHQNSNELWQLVDIAYPEVSIRRCAERSGRILGASDYCFNPNKHNNTAVPNGRIVQSNY